MRYYLSLVALFVVLIALSATPYLQQEAREGRLWTKANPFKIPTLIVTPCGSLCDPPEESVDEERQDQKPANREPTPQMIATMLRIDIPLAEEISEAVHRESQAYVVDPWLILALIKVESDGRPHVRSKAGALGLMQVMPETGKGLAAELGEEWRGERQLFEVDTNIRYGTRYLRQLFERFEDAQIAVAAYNWGPTHIAGRIERGSELPRQYSLKVLAALPPVRPSLE